MSETNRRRAIQKAHNDAHGITPTSVVRAIRPAREDDGGGGSGRKGRRGRDRAAARELPRMTTRELDATLERLRKEMFDAARDLDFERAAELRDRVRSYEALALEMT